MTNTAPRPGATVVLDGVTKTFAAGGVRVSAARGVSLDVPAGAMVALTGPSGSGKSTLLHLVGAIEAPDEGTITVDGAAVASLRGRRLAAYRRGIGFVFQRYHLLPALTALENVLAPVLPYRVDYPKVERARQMLAAVGLADRERSLPSQLSGGQQQRVAIARALVGRPELLLADEPTGNLDTIASRQVLDLLEKINAERQTTIVMVTHDPTLAARARRKLHVLDGRLIDPNAAREHAVS